MVEITVTYLSGIYLIGIRKKKERENISIIYKHM